VSAAWPKVRLGEVLKLRDSSVPVDSLGQVNLAGVYSFGRGLFKRGPLTPAKTSYRTYNRLVANDFVISQPKAWEGALARVTLDFQDWYLSPVFPTFRANEERLDPRFLEWFCKRAQVWAELVVRSRGIGARRESVSPEQFLSLEIPLPAPAEQQRIVARIEELAAKIAEARSLRQQTVQESDGVCRAILSSDAAAAPTPLRELVRLRDPDVLVRPEDNYQFAGVYCFGRGVFRGQRRSGMDFAYSRLTRLRRGDFVYPKLMAWEGALAVVPLECDGYVVSTEYPVFAVIESRVLPEVLDTYFGNPAVWPDIAGASTGTNVRRRRLNPKDFLNYKMPLPSRATQERLREVRGKLNKLNKLQAQTAVELDALLPSILDKAFNGGL
jgi:type I restriction enzyme, S subunit